MPALPPHDLTTLALAALLYGAVSAVRPRWALAVLLGALPLFLHQPHSPWALRLIVLVGVFEVAYAARRWTGWRAVWAATAEQPILFLAALFAVAAFLSLSSMPLLAVWRQHAALLNGVPAAGWPQYVAGLLTLQEFTREYSITSALLTLQAFVLAAVVSHETRRTGGGDLLFPRAIAAGLAAFVALGLLESFGALNLGRLRGEIGVFPRTGTLQSTAGNPGWFAEYMVFALPYGLVLLAGGNHLRWRLSALTVFAAGTSFALVLCFQRGGWLAGLVVVSYLVAAAAYVLTRQNRSPRGLGTAAVRAVAWLALVATLAGGGFYLWLGRTGDNASAPGGFTAEAFLSRLTSIAQADRVEYWKAGAMVGGLHPVLGGGIESFGYRYRMYFEQPGGRYHRSTVRVPEGTSAHSLYAQTFAGTGSIGLVILLGLLACASLGLVQALRGPPLEGSARVGLLAAFGSLVGVASYGLVQEVFYVHALRLLFFVNLGLMAGSIPARTATSARLRQAAFAALGAALALHLVYERAYPGEGRLLADGEQTGFYQQEHDRSGKVFRWSTDWATLPLPAGARGYGLELRSVAPFPQHVRVSACGDERELTLSDQAWRRVSSPVACPGGRVVIEVAPAWRPPAEERVLGVMVSGVEMR